MAALGTARIFLERPELRGGFGDRELRREISLWRLWGPRELLFGGFGDRVNSHLGPDSGLNRGLFLGPRGGFCATGSVLLSRFPGLVFLRSGDSFSC